MTVFGSKSTRAARAFAIAAALASLVACGSKVSTAPSSANVEFSFQDLVVGTGAEVVTGATLVLDYDGYLYDSRNPDNAGTLFASSFSSVNPFAFVLGSGSVIAGWEKGIPGMRIGGRRVITIPPSLAYGSTGSGSVPPNTALIFDITIYGQVLPADTTTTTSSIHRALRVR